MNRKRLKFCTNVFIAEMRRQATILGSPITIKKLDEYKPEQVSALMSAVAKANAAASPVSDAAFEAWSEKQAISSEK